MLFSNVVLDGRVSVGKRVRIRIRVFIWVGFDVVRAFSSFLFKEKRTKNLWLYSFFNAAKAPKILNITKLALGIFGLLRVLGLHCFLGLGLGFGFAQTLFCF